MNKIKKIMHEIKWKLMADYYRRFVSPESKILDVGAGELYISKLMQDYLKSKVIGVDVMDYGTNFVEHYVIKDNKLPFPNKSFDVVTFNDVLHHIDIEGQKSILMEAKRAGKKIIILEDAKNFMSCLLDFLTNRPSMPKALSHKDIQEWKDFMRKLGFKIAYHKVKKPFYYPLKHYIFTIDL